MKNVINFCLFCSLLMGSNLVMALEVDREVAPRITIGGRIITSIDNRNFDSDLERHSGFNLNDSTLLMRFDKRMFSKGVAGATIGIKEEGEGEKKSILMQELHAFYWNKDFAVTLGRTRLHNTLIEFPLIRDDDFLEYTHVGNASSNNDDFDQLYAEQLSIDWFVDNKVQRVNLWSGTRVNDDTIMSAPNGFDSWGIGYVYEQAEDLLYVSRLRHAGILLDKQKIGTSLNSTAWISSLIAGVEFNLNENPLSSWSMSWQAIYNQGAKGIVAADISNGASNSVSKRAASPSRSLVTSIRYTARPHLLTRWQSALTVAYKNYNEITSASQWSVSPNFIYRLGQGVDLLSQIKYTEYGANMGIGHDTTVQFGISFSLDQSFNDTIGERDSILNLEHGYID